MTKRKALIDIAYDVLSKKRKPLPFKNLWLEVKDIAELSDEQAGGQLGQFYSDMSLDSRFIQKEENKWDLKKRYKFEDTYIELDDLDSDDEEENDSYYDEDSLEEDNNQHLEEDEEDY